MTSLLVAGLLSGCASYENYISAGTEDNFVADDNIFRVDPNDYPVFAVKQNLEAPWIFVIPPISKGVQKPPLEKTYRWEVTHVVKGRYLIGSNEYDYVDCKWYADRPGNNVSTRDCDFPSAKARGSQYFSRIYINPNGHGYGWESIKNQERWFGRAKLTKFLLDNTGDWSGQPWFECIERCDKLANMTNYFDDTRTGFKAKYPIMYKGFIDEGYGGLTIGHSPGVLSTNYLKGAKM
ncbi:hypothetical protein [Halotalea alkalilenta]|uniref:hypothetical protein n=1 Tax=Halotalea alkalilenta TaxID=376489 RepID=UPI0012DDF040|nr:hypothetical protein [Halotalea alkalilenta]